MFLIDVLECSSLFAFHKSSTPTCVPSSQDSRPEYLSFSLMVGNDPDSTTNGPRSDLALSRCVWNRLLTRMMGGKCRYFSRTAAWRGPWTNVSRQKTMWTNSWSSLPQKNFIIALAIRYSRFLETFSFVRSRICMNLVARLFGSRLSTNSSKIFGISAVSHAPRDIIVCSGTSRSLPTLLNCTTRTDSAVVEGVTAVEGVGVGAVGAAVGGGVIARSGCLMGEITAGDGGVE